MRYRTFLKIIFAVVVFLAPLFSKSVHAQLSFTEIPIEKPRVLVLTDIANEPDDQESLVRFLSYANEFDIEGFVATTSNWMRDTTRADVIREIIDAYGEVRDNLEKHASGFPSEEYLMNRVTSHLPVYGMEGVGAGKSTDGSRHIIDVVDNADDRPVWVTVWGGANALAQALWKVRETRSTEALDAFISKMKVYTISDQDDAGIWIRNNFPDLFYIVSPSEPDGGQWYHRATWTGIAGDKFYQNGPGHKFELVENEWLRKNVMENHGPLGAQYPEHLFIMEGDTPSYLGLIRNGLGWSLSPAYGGWGGRYQHLQPFGEASPIWTNGRNSRDRVIAEDGNAYVSDQATIWRWREAFQYDFEARIDWGTMPYEDANHNPKAVVNGHKGKSVLKVTAAPGDTIRLDAAKSSDPDGDQVSYKWWVYPEAGTLSRWWTFRWAETHPGDTKISNPNSAATDIIIPHNFLEEVPGRSPKENSIHIILEVIDDGKPELRSYRRVIVEVIEEEKLTLIIKGV